LSHFALKQRLIETIRRVAVSANVSLKHLMTAQAFTQVRSVI